MSVVVVPDNAVGYVYLSSIIRSLSKGGKFFSVRFLKKDGSMRDMVARLGVVKHVKDSSKPYVPKPFNNVLTVWDTQKREYRAIPLDRVESIKISGNETQVVYASLLRRIKA
jgi:hypothetical protein